MGITLVEAALDDDVAASKQEKRVREKRERRHHVCEPA